jgi:hypothetical protein
MAPIEHSVGLMPQVAHRIVGHRIPRDRRVAAGGDGVILFAVLTDGSEM